MRGQVRLFSVYADYFVLRMLQRHTQLVSRIREMRDIPHASRYCKQYIIVMVGRHAVLHLILEYCTTPIQKMCF